MKTILSFLSRYSFWVLLLGLGLLFVVSSLFFHSGQKYQSYTLLFPSAKSEYREPNFTRLYAEQRKIPIPQVLPPKWSQRERTIYYLVKELLYGPGPRMIRAYPFVPTGTEVNNLAIQNESEGESLYIDLNARLLSGESEHYFSVAAMLALIEKVLRLNFPGLDAIYFTVDSQDIQKIPQVR